MSLVDRSFIRRLCPQVAFHTVGSELITVRGIGSDRYTCKEYVCVELMILGTLPPGQRAVTVLICELHVVDNLKAGSLLGVDILG